MTKTTADPQADRLVFIRRDGQERAHPQEVGQQDVVGEDGGEEDDGEPDLGASESSCASSFSGRL